MRTGTTGKARSCAAVWVAVLGLGTVSAQQTAPVAPPSNARLMEYMRNVMPPQTQSLPLYGESAIPNAKPAPDTEVVGPMGSLVHVSRPTLEVYLPAKSKANGASVLVFPGGGYVGLTWVTEGPAIAQFLQDHGIAAFVVKYRLPSDTTMEDKSIGPLQDAQQAMLIVRQRAKDWNLDPNRIGAIGFSAGGHLASSLGTHFAKSYVANPNQTSLRPDFLVLVYPVISMDLRLTHMGSRNALLGATPTDEQVRLFSNELQVSKDTPPTLLLHSADDRLVDVDNSIQFFEALRHANVPVDMTVFDKGQHGFVLIPNDQWQAIVMHWIEANGWLKPKAP